MHIMLKLEMIEQKQNVCSPSIFCIYIINIMRMVVDYVSKYEMCRLVYMYNKNIYLKNRKELVMK